MCKQTWLDIKNRVKKKATNLVVARRRTGNRPIKKEEELDAQDLKVISIMGPAYIEGIPGSVDSMPESEVRRIKYNKNLCTKKYVENLYKTKIRLRFCS